MKSFNQSGSIFILALIALTVILVGTMAIISFSFTYKQSSKYNLEKLDAVTLAEAGVDKAVASLNKSSGSYNGEAETQLGTGTYEVNITSLDASNKVVEAVGFVPNKTTAKTKQSIKIQVSKGDGVAFSYGLQVGEGGLNLGNGSQLNGSVYSNGNINVGSSNIFTGDVWVAGGTQSQANQQTECSDPNCADYLFGNTISGETRLDVAQSFTPSQSAIINKVALKLKKIGSPPNVTVRILGDSSGKPNKNDIKASGTLSANLVTSTYGFVDVTFSTSPTLNSGITYWIVIDTSSNSTNYWAWSNDTTQGYTPGQPKWSPNWQASNPVWNTFVGDLGFKVFMGGVTTSIQASSGSRVNGDVHANTISGLTINGNAYYQSISSSTVNGTSYPGSNDPAPANYPVSQSNIDEWKTEAQTPPATITNSDVILSNGCNVTLGPGKLNGNLSLGNSCQVTINTPYWVNGNITTGNGAIFKLPVSSGASSGVVLASGTVVLGNGSDFKGSGTAGSYLMLLSLYDSRTNGNNAFTAGNGALSGIIYLPTGIANFGNGASFKELVAWKIVAGNNSILTYESGLANIFFSAGPTGSFNVVKGTYQLK